MIENEYRKHPISIRFLLYEYGRKERNTYPVYALVVLKRKSTQLSLKMFAKPDDWDFENGRYLTQKQFCVYANNQLADERNKILKAYYDAREHISDPDLKMVIELYKGKIYESTQMGFLEWYDAFSSEIKLLPDQYSYGALEHYRKTRIHLEMYLKKKGQLRLKLSQLKREFIVGFEHHLRTTPNIQHGGEPMNANTAATYLKKVKAVVNAAIRRELIPYNPFVGYQVKKGKTTTRVYLTLDEIEALEALELSKQGRLEKARDFFLFSVYTGLRHSDALNLKSENVRTDNQNVSWISIVQIKTKENLEVPMLEPAERIYKKYEELRKQTGYILPQFENHLINRDIKILAKMAGITKHVSHHVARHTFATTVLLEKGVELKITSKLLGHSSIKTSEIYAKVSTIRLVDTMNQVNKLL